MFPLSLHSPLFGAPRDQEMKECYKAKLVEKMHKYIMMIVDICMTLIGEQDMDVKGIWTKNTAHAIIVLKITT